jgi:hypothetical protein
MKLSDIILPPAPPATQRRRQSIIRVLAAGTAVAGLVFLALAMILAGCAFASLRQGSILTAALWCASLLAVYLGTGVALCALFMSRLRLWGGATLGTVLQAKRHFVRSWPFASIAVLRDLLLHRMTGSGLQSSYWAGR